MRILTTGVLSIFLATSSLAQEPVDDMVVSSPAPTLVRVPKCPCDSKWCMTRDMVDKINTTFDSEASCREDLTACRKEKGKVVSRGWNPLSVIVVAGGVVIVIGGAASALGVLLAK